MRPMRSVVLAGGGTNAHPARTGESAPRREIRFYSQRPDVLIETIGVHHLCPSPHEVFHEFLLCVVAPIHLRRDRAIQGPFLARRARGRTDTAEVAEGCRGGSAPPDPVGVRALFARPSTTISGRRSARHRWRPWCRWSPTATRELGPRNRGESGSAGQARGA
jgi:hypothetical protein